jgi:hypothetical protein
MEWGLVAVGLFAGFSMFHTSRSATRRVRKSFRGYASKQRRRAELKEELRRL